MLVAAGARTVRVTSADSSDELPGRLAACREDGSLVIVDDAHRLGSDVLKVLTKAVRDGVAIAISRRPTIDSPALAELDEAVVAAGGDVTMLDPLTTADTAALIRNATGVAPSTERAGEIQAESAGWPVIATMIATAPAGTVPVALVARVQQRLAIAGAPATRVARVLALGLELPDGVLSQASDVPLGDLPLIVRLLRDSGLLVADADRLVPAVSAAIRADLSPVELRRVHSDVAHALLAVGADSAVVAAQLRTAQVLGPVAADVYRSAGERVRFTEPDAALTWFDDAAHAGAPPGELTAGRAEALALLGLPVDGLLTSTAGADQRLALVMGAVEAHHGRADRAAEILLSAGSLGSALAVPALMSTGRRADAQDAQAAITSGVPPSVRRFAEAATALERPTDALPLFIEAAEAFDRSAPGVVLPDTPHALGAVVGVLVGDANTAERLLRGAISAGVGGPVASDRHRLLHAWVLLRAGRYDAALAELSRTADMQLTGRDRLVRACLAAGVARRSGDIATLREAWEQSEHILARRAVDLFQLECVEELAVAAARLGKVHRAMPIVGALEGVIDHLGQPSCWSVALDWIHVQIAVALDDAEAADGAVHRLEDRVGLVGRQEAQRNAAKCWAAILKGHVNREAVLAAADALDIAELPWEASRLAGQAAIRTADPDDARRLLERARAFIHVRAESSPQNPRSELLSERELEVARMVLAGRTHREIGAQLYVSPKTVEHHVARIRAKLGVRTRAEFVAALRVFFAADDPSSGETPNAL